MPLTGSDSALSSALRSAILAADCGAIDDAPLTGLCDAIASTVLAHLVANAVVLPTTLGVPSLISAAPGAPVTGTGSLT